MRRQLDIKWMHLYFGFFSTKIFKNYTSKQSKTCIFQTNLEDSMNPRKNLACLWFAARLSVTVSRKEKVMTADEMVRQHHKLNGCEFQQTPGNTEGQGSLECCNPWGHQESDTIQQLNSNISTKLLAVLSLCIAFYSSEEHCLFSRSPFENNKAH